MAPSKRKETYAAAAVETSIEELFSKLTTCDEPSKAKPIGKEKEVSSKSVSELPALRPYQEAIVSEVNHILDHSTRTQQATNTHGKKGEPSTTDADASLIKNESMIIYLPTGGGKTRTALDICKTEVFARNGVVLFIVNRDTLTKQAKEAFSKLSEIKVTVLDNKNCDKIYQKCKDGKCHVLISTIQMFTARFLKKKKTSDRATKTKSNLSKKEGIVRDDSKKNPELDDAVEEVQGNVVENKSKPPSPEFSMVIIDECHCAHAPTYQALASVYSSARYKEQMDCNYCFIALSCVCVCLFVFVFLCLI
jgi:type I site-specific restriction-modification system R (restriction) subunit